MSSCYAGWTYAAAVVCFRVPAGTVLLGVTTATAAVFEKERAWIFDGAWAAFRRARAAGAERSIVCEEAVRRRSRRTRER